MSYPTVTTIFENGPGHTILASELNQNDADLVAALSDGTKDIRVDNIEATGQHTITGFSKLGGAEKVKIKEYKATIVAADMTQGYILVPVSVNPAKVRGMIAGAFCASTDFFYVGMFVGGLITFFTNEITLLSGGTSAKVPTVNIGMIYTTAVDDIITVLIVEAE